MGYNTHVAKPKPGQWQTRHAPGFGHQVIDPDGNVYGVYHNPAHAETARDGMQARTDAAAKRMPRGCICCGNKFLSEGIHNRMCPSCRHRTDGLDPHAIAPRSGRAK